MAELKLPEKNNPSSFNAGANLKNNNVPTADQKVKKMSTGETGSDKGEDLKNSVKNGADGLKRNLKKEAIAIGVQALSSGAVDRSVTKQALNNKLGDKLVDSIQTPTEKYRSNKEKIRQKRIANDEEPDYPMLWFDALPASMKILLIFGILLFIGLMFFVSIFVTLFEDDSMMKAQSFGYISSQNIGNKISNITNRESSLADKFKSIFGMFITKDFDNIGNVFSNDSKCSGSDCDSRAEVLYFQKISDISYRYKKLYNVDLDWPLIVASNLINSSDKEETFRKNLSDYESIENLDEVMNLDWEYDYESIEDYTYLDAADSRYDLQLLAKNMVTKTTVQSCIDGDEVLKTTTLIDVLDSELTKESENYLVCDKGKYVIESTYSLDTAKYDEFLSEYLEHKHFMSGSGTPNRGGAVIDGANDLASAFLSVAKQQLNQSDNSIYWKYMGYTERVSWCAAFVAWVSNNTTYDGQKLYPNIIKHKTASAAGYMLYFNNSADSNINFEYNTSCGKYSSKGNYIPKQGDIIFFDWSQSWDGNFSNIVIGNGVIDHVGIVEKVEDGKVYTIEGNSSDDVRSRNYSLNNCKIVGYGTWY